MSLPALRTAPDDLHVDYLVDVLGRCAGDVFATMVGRPLTPGHSDDGGTSRPAGSVVGMVGFAGSSTGLVVFSTTVDAAREITAGLLDVGEAAGASRDDVADAIGEIANMIAGSFRTRMATDGDCWAITVPTVTMGSDFYIKPMSSGRRALIPFRMGRHEILVELILTEQQARR